jgi:hypothetical protein
MQQSVAGKEMLMNHNWNNEMVKWNNGNEYVVKYPPPSPQLKWLHILMQLGIGYEIEKGSRAW